MSDSDLQRLRDDLATIRQAAGLELPFGREDVRLGLWLGAAGVFGLVWSVLPHGLPAPWGLLPLVALALGYALWARVRYSRRSGRSAVRRREYTLALMLALVVGGLALVYRLWVTPLGLSYATRAAIGIFFSGVALTVLALSDRRRISSLGLAIPLMVSALLMPYVFIPAAGLLGAAVAVGGPLMAAIQARQLRGREAFHDAD